MDVWSHDDKNKMNMREDSVTSVAKKITKKRLKWCGPVRRREEELRGMADAPVQGQRWRGRQTTRCL